MAKLSETALVILSNAATRDDLKIFPVPKGLRAPAPVVRKTLGALLRAGHLAEVHAARGDTVWEEAPETGRTTLVATGHGLKAAGIDEGRPVEPPWTPRWRSKLPARAKKASRKALSGSTAAMVGRPGSRPPEDRSAARGARVGQTAGKRTKQDILVAMLRRGGASIEDMAAATGWQPHSVRGVLSATIKGRLKLPLVSEKDAKGTRRYRVR